MANLDFYESVRNVPETGKKTIGAGRLKGMTDINPMWRIKVLTEQCGPCGFGWRYEIVRQWLETAGNEVRAFCNINLFIKIGEEWSQAIPGTGGSSFVTMERNGQYVSDECFKMALTDAISVAAKALGVGADVYFSKDVPYGSKYEGAPQQSPPQAPTPQLPPEMQQALDIALNDIKQCNSVNELLKIWNELTTLQRISAFSNAVSRRKKELENG